MSEEHKEENEEIQSQKELIREIAEQVASDREKAAATHLEEIKIILAQAKTNQKELFDLLENNRTSSATSAEEAATHLEEIKTSLTQAKANQKELLDLLENNRTSSATSVEEVDTHLEEIKASLSQAKTNRTDLLGLLEKARTDSAEIAEIARTADIKDQKVNEYQDELKTLQKEYGLLKNKIENLLPGATGTGLAKAFNRRKEALKPTLKWSRYTFITSIIGFIALGFWALIGENIKTISEFFIFTFERSPIIVGLVLLEEFSRRLYNTTLKLEEDYAYKETLSTAFDGYKKAMTVIDDGDEETLAKTFSTNVLNALNAWPGRLYESEKDDTTSTKTILAALRPEGNDSREKLALRIYDDLKQSLKGTVFKVVMLLLIVATIAGGAGYYFGIIGNSGSKTITVTQEQTK